MMMRTKHLVLISLVLLILLGALLVFAEDDDDTDYDPSFFESWEGDQNNILTNFWRAISPLLSKYDVEEDADMYGWYKETWFTIAGWEKEVCLIDLSNEVRSLGNVVLDDDTAEEVVYTTTITVSAKKQLFYNGSYMYEVSWYIHPFNDDALFRVFLSKGGSKEYFAGKSGDDDDDWESATQYQGNSGFEIRYLSKVYDEVVLEYMDEGSDDVNEMVVNVIDKE